MIYVGIFNFLAVFFMMGSMILIGRMPETSYFMAMSFSLISGIVIFYVNRDKLKLFIGE